MIHDPAKCGLPFCRPCDIYGEGYTAGKAKTHFELRTWEIGAHAPDCGCEACGTARVLVRKALVAPVEPGACQTDTSRTAPREPRVRAADSGSGA